MKKTVQDIDVRGKRVIVRCDFNVPMKDGKITDDTRIVAALPTIKYLIGRGAKVILMSHLGRPKGKPDHQYTLEPVAERISQLLEKQVFFAQCDQVVVQEIVDASKDLNPGDVVLLENLRFRPEEEANDPVFAQDLASLADIYVSDAFGTVHRAHASTAGIAKYLIELEMKAQYELGRDDCYHAIKRNFEERTGMDLDEAVKMLSTPVDLNLQ